MLRNRLTAAADGGRRHRLIGGRRGREGWGGQ